MGCLVGVFGSVMIRRCVKTHPTRLASRVKQGKRRRVAALQNTDGASRCSLRGCAGPGYRNGNSRHCIVNWCGRGVLGKRFSSNGHESARRVAEQCGRGGRNGMTCRSSGCSRNTDDSPKKSLEMACHMRKNRRCYPLPNGNSPRPSPRAQGRATLPLAAMRDPHTCRARSTSRPWHTRRGDGYFRLGSCWPCCCHHWSHCCLSDPKDWPVSSWSVRAI